MFILIFHDKKRLLRLYNAISGRNYTNPEQLTITTLENAIYMSMKNDLSFLIGMRLSLYEHQSTFNPNMVIRFLFYLADVYSTLLKDYNLYSTKKIMIPPPRFIVFYNGVGKLPDHEVIRLSDSYIIQEEPISLELVLEDKAEAKKVSIYEYNEEDHMRMEREDAFEDGVAEGLAIGREEGLAAGRGQIVELISKMTADGLGNQASRLGSDPTFYQEMMKKYFG